MPVFNDIDENFTFIVLEITKQLDETLKVLDNPNERYIEAIQARDDYIDNLKTVIENKCFSRILNDPDADKHTVALMRALNIIANNLEKIGDYLVSIVGQIQYLDDPLFLKQYDYQAFFDEIFNALSLLIDAITKRDISMALRICKSEFSLDELYDKSFQKILVGFSKGDQTGNLVTILFIFRYLERAGDALLNIGEAIIFAIIGEKLKIHQYQALEETLASSEDHTTISESNIDSIWGGRSGCRIGKVSSKNSREVLFKEGNVNKLSREKENLEKWGELYPGLAPKIINYQSTGQSASIIVEYLFGSTLQHIILNETSPASLNTVLLMIKKTMKSLWESTMKPNPVKSSYLNQLSSRLEDIYKVHPDFMIAQKKIGTLKSLSFDNLLEKAYSIDQDIYSPFSVFIHGDFNINNIIYNGEEQKIHFIDVYRSKDMDYVQDISVFVVSNFRLPIFDRRIRDRLNYVILDFYKFAKDFAYEHKDDNFTARMTLGLIRSFMTSTRFELNKDFAKAMQLRAIYLLEKFVSYSGEWKDFQLAEEVLIY